MTAMSRLSLLIALAGLSGAAVSGAQSFPQVMRGETALGGLSALGGTPLYHTPRFLVPGWDTLAPPVPIEPERVAELRQPVALSLDGVTRAEALAQLSRVSGIDFVYADNLLPEGRTVNLKSRAITVFAALSQILINAGLDVLLRPDGSAVLVNMPRVTPADVPAIAAPADTLRGRVIGPDSVPLAGVVVSVTSNADQTTKSARTDSAGTYRVVFDNTAPGYTIAITMPGFTPQRRPVTRTVGATGAIVADFRLTKATQTLAPIRAVAGRPKPQRDYGFVANPGETGAIFDPYASLTGDATGDFTMALTMQPGLTVTPDPNGGLPSISFAGLGSDQNGLSLNGADFGGMLPRDAAFLRVFTATYDPAKGFFSGVLTSATIFQANFATVRSLHATLDAPYLQWTTPVGTRLSQQYSMPILSGTNSGPIGHVGHFLTTSFQFQRRAQDLTTLTSASPASLAALGVSPDSVARLVSALGPLGIPARVSAVPAARVATGGSASMRLDFAPSVGGTVFQTAGGGIGTGYALMNPPPRSVSSLIATGSFMDNTGLMTGPTALPSHGGDSRNWSGSLQFLSSNYIFGSLLNETNSALSVGGSRTNPYLDLPSASVLLNSTLPDGAPTVSLLQAAGNGTGPNSSRNWSWQTKNETRWETWDNEHDVKLALEGTVDHYALTQGPSFGVFGYNSLGDFTSGTPASFSRTLTNFTDDGQGVRGAIGIGDVYRPRRTFATQYGARLEGYHFDVRPAFNPTVDSLFAMRTDHVPNVVTFAPMAGFTWWYSTDGRGFPVPGKTLVGGIRDYRGVLRTQSIDPYTRQTGLPTGVQQVECVGAAIPAPNWSAYTQSQGAIPDACADGTSGSALAQTTPPVALFSPDYALSHSWRADLTWSYPITQRLAASINGNQAINLSLPDRVDANFNPVTRFTLPGEDARPVFVPASSVVPASGAVTSAESRLFPQYAQVSALRSDLRGESRQLTGQLNFTPLAPSWSSAPSMPVSLAYTWSDIRSQQDGFTGTTAGDPRQVYWSSNGTPQHTVILQTTFRAPGFVSIGAGLRVQSGFAYTPRVNADVNGDGFANDRAFVFNPATAADPAVSAAMTSLLQAAPQSAHDCLMAQLGTVANQNSCRGPWSANLNLSAAFDAYRLGFKNRGTVQLRMGNTLGAIDQLLHGANKLHGWGQPAFPDATLLNVRGFDPLTNRFQYTVNPLFGSTSVATHAFRPPFTVTLDIHLDLAPDRERTFIAAYLKPRPADSTDVLNETQIRTRLLGRSGGAFTSILQIKDSLDLTQAQVDSLNAINKRYLAARDSIYRALARYLASRHGDYSGDETDERWHDAIAAVVRTQWRLGQDFLPLLTRAQFEHGAAMRMTNPFGQGYITYDPAALERYIRGPLSSPP
jgi:hypothetical protein